MMFLRIVGPTRAVPVYKIGGDPGHRFYEVSTPDGLDTELVEIENHYILDSCAEAIARQVGLHHLIQRIAAEYR